MVRTPCCKEEGIKKGAWTPEEDEKLIAYLRLHGEGGWRTLPEKAGLKRCGKSCRLRWANYLRPDIKRGEFSPEEDDLIIKLHALKGNKWAAIATNLAGRTDNEIKNYWNTNLKKRLKQKGLDPITHKPIDTSTGSLQSEKHKRVCSSGSARVLNRIASKYAVEFNRDLLTGIISGKSKIADSTASTLQNKMIKPNDYYTASTSSDNCSFSDDGLNNFFSNQEISGDMLTKVDNFGFMEELKGILSYDYVGGNFKDSSGNEMKFLDSWNEEEDDDMDLYKFVGLLDPKVGGVFV